MRDESTPGAVRPGRAAPRRAPLRRRRLRSAPMLSRDQVLHVARLARLELTDEEVERFGGELSKVLDHIELIGELGDLADVPPTSHVVDVENALRADEPRPSLPRREGARERARRRPAAASACRARERCMIELTAAQAAARASRTGDLDAGEYFEFYRRARGRRTPSTPTSGSPRRRRSSTRTRRSRASRSRSRTSSAPRASRARPARRSSRATARPTRRRRVRNLKAAGGTLLGKTNQDEFAMGSSTENSAYGPTLNPWDTTRVPGGSSGGSAASVAAGTAPWSIGTDTGGSIRQPAALCGIVGLKPTYGAISRYGMIAFASSLDQAGTFTRDVTDTALLLSGMVGAGPVRQHEHRPARSRSSCRPRRDLKGIRLGVPEELTGEGIEPGVLAAFNDTLDMARELGATVETMHLPHAPHGARGVLPARARRVLVEPRPLRRRALRLPRQGRHRRPARHVHQDARGGLRPRGQAPDHARHLRAVVAATTTPTTARRRRSAR